MTLEEKYAKAVEALREITKREGPFSMDRLTHANNTIEHMATVAENALDELGEDAADETD